MVEVRTTILIAAADNVSILVAPLLSSLGIQTVPVNNSKELIEKAKQITSGIIILDEALPGTDILDIIKILKNTQATVRMPIILLSELPSTENRLQALEAGVDDFLTKPIDNAELKARIKCVLKVKAYNENQSHFEKNLETEVSKRTESLKQAFEKIKVASLDTIFRLSRAAEYKDTDTGTHIERMSHYSTAIARQMKLHEEFIENILYASPMHDIGKIGIPDRVLQKPGKLDNDEWEIMRKHTIIGAEILKDSKVEFMSLAEQIAIAHHEKWDGTGYPKKTKGTEIPLAARIVALADVFDALTSERPYKQPMELEKSCSIIVEGKGTHFDPDVVDAFIAIKEEIAASLSWWKFMGSNSEENDLFK